MKKFLLPLCLSLFSSTYSFGQLALYNTRTLFDAFENPSQKAFYADSSRRFAFNFLIPTVSANATVSGNAQIPLKRLLYTGKLDSRGLAIGDNQFNEITVTENTYLATFKIFKSVKFHKEMGFSWQLRSDTYGQISDETVAIFQSYKNFGQALYENPFNNEGFNINYHQLSFTYREDYNKRLGLGLKVSYLSGIAHSEVDINSSALQVSKEQDAFSLSLKGKFRSNISWDEADKKMLYPGFKNPGLALGLSANYKLRGGWYVLGNIKDLGFIKWSKKEGYTYTFDDNITIDAASSPNANSRLSSRLQRLFDKGSAIGSYSTLINGKAEFLVNKDFGNYQPHLFISKNIFYPGGDIALINRIRRRALNLSLTTAYNMNNFFQLGGQFMIKSPNAELFIGSDQILKSYYTAKGAFTSNENIGKGNTAASVYFGMAFKFGPIMERWQNANSIPGVEGTTSRSFFQRVFRKKGRGYY